ncbi:MAG: putative addiction module antidote protein [Gammaproteobacteria bacterium]|jgi:probable addiction module antidote protein|nr:putative addiction module antidote protein [Gammaproteobacteria bacterium]MBT3893754.1 putative addiction module antidote protein [Gammaproteobacteria bacterium]MBT4788272.1 putative addiction module antidote protein [Gammaproteobacteria bacterium]MBT6880130.1 putative addiction module antidote protein [Gammaproteobacteria bacterium]MBT7479642.1 putative addiction module antidote protein [Gammaproteobacteria bacterium]
MATQTGPYNPIDYLESDDEIMEYLNDAYLDDDPRAFVLALGNCAKHYGISKLSGETGLNRESLYKSFSGSVQPKWDTIQRVMKAMNIQIHVEAA